MASRFFTLLWVSLATFPIAACTSTPAQQQKAGGGGFDGGTAGAAGTAGASGTAGSRGVTVTFVMTGAGGFAGSSGMPDAATDAADAPMDANPADGSDG